MKGRIPLLQGRINGNSAHTVRKPAQNQKFRLKLLEIRSKIRNSGPTARNPAIEMRKGLSPWSFETAPACFPAFIDVSSAVNRQPSKIFQPLSAVLTNLFCPD
ncbi:hypothetical protein BTO30_06365 [Domibacillus antri]|uniref:Uncharacterized protein n=1 Tax=Domibacillus antri TaxID=1714264 RepID=A0A1Q8Q6S9_9BACI|nr:hypothetical protein BTO30_06365 [Domibacillus antri]